MYFIYSLFFLAGIVSISRLPDWHVLISIVIVLCYKKNNIIILLQIYLIGAALAGYQFSLVKREKLSLEELYNLPVIVNGQVKSIDNHNNILLKLKFINYNHKIIKFKYLYLKLYLDNSGLVNFNNKNLIRFNQNLNLKLKLKQKNLPYNFITNNDLNENYNKIFAKPVKINYKELSQNNTDQANQKNQNKQTIALREFLWDSFIINSLKLPNNGIILALLFGERGYLTDYQKNIFTVTGTGHLIAISGMHISLMFLLIYKLSKYLWIYLFLIINKFKNNITQDKFSLVAALIFTFAYCYISGFSIPTQRAFVAIACFILAKLFFYNIHSSNIFGLCIIFVLIYDPTAAYTASFWLSFSATFCLLYLYTNRFQVLKCDFKQNLISNLMSGLMSGIISCSQMFIALMPITLFYFNKITVTSILANIIAIPVISFLVLPLIFLALLINIFISNSLILNLVDYLLTKLILYLNYLNQNLVNNTDIFNGVINGIVNIIFNQNYIYLNNFDIFILVLIVFLFLAPKGLPVYSPIGLLSLIFYFNLNHNNFKNPNKLVIDLLDVGQGLSVLINTNNHQLLYDTGPKLFNNYIADKVVSNTILNYKTKLDAVVISHWDADHSANLANIITNIKPYNIKKIYSSSLEKNNLILNIKSDYCNKDYTWVWDNITFSFLKNNESTEYLKNNSSCILKITNNNTSILLTGDIERKTELYLVDKHKKILQADLLLAPHHGSKTSSSLEFIEQVAPKYALIAVGLDNIYKLPSNNIINRYTELGIKIFRTDQQGAVRVSVANDQITFETAIKSG